LRYVTEILLNIPPTSRLDGSSYGDTKKLLENPKFKEKLVINTEFTPKDLGSITKLLPAVKYTNHHYQDGDALIIALDSNVAYPRSLVIEMMYSLSYHTN